MASRQTNEQYHRHFSGKRTLPDLNLKEVWEYRDLIFLFARREFVVNYKQTILGPLWIFISPMLTSFMYAFVFGKVAGINTDGTPKILFYLFSTAAWALFSTSVNSCAETFTQNAPILSKVYFPRLVMPLSSLLSAYIHFFLQMIPALFFYIYFLAAGEISVTPLFLLLLPVSLLQMGLLGYGFGIIVAALTTKYRDLRILIRFGLSLWMYATPVVYPLSALDGRAARWISANPVAFPMELFRFGLWGKGRVSSEAGLMSWIVTLAVLAVGIVLFNRVERIFADTV